MPYFNITTTVQTLSQQLASFNCNLFWYLNKFNFELGFENYLNCFFTGVNSSTRLFADVSSMTSPIANMLSTFVCSYVVIIFWFLC